MTRLGANLRMGIVVAFALGLLQALIGAIAVGWLYADLLLAPTTFFNVRMYDASMKLHTWLATSYRFPPVGNRFLETGWAVKLALVPQLILTDLALALPIGIAAALATTLTGSDASTTRRRALRLTLAIVAAEVALHTGDWLSGVHVPASASLRDLAHNGARNFLFDGTVIALTVLLAAAVPAAATGRWLGGHTAAAVTAAVLSVGATGWLATRSPLVHAEPSLTEAPEKPALARDYNVILISIDSLRADHLSVYGYPRATSPTIDDLAARGVVFRRTSSTTAWTLPAHISMLTGRSLLGHGVVSDDRMLTSDVPTLAESFRGAGYTTGAIVSAPYVEARYGFSRGFDHYDDRTIRFASHGESYDGVTAPTLQRAADAWLSANADRRFFMFLHYWDVHYDYAPGAPYDTMFDPDYEGEIDGGNFYFNAAVNRHMPRRDLEHVVALYDGEIRLVDDHLGLLRKSLQRLGIADRTVLVVTADHGEEFFEHGRKGHHRSLYDEIIRVPLVLHVPGVAPTRPVVDMEASIIDIVPTVLSLVGIRVPAGVEGVDLGGIAYRGEDPWDRMTLSELYRLNSLNVQAAIRQGEAKVVHHFNHRLIERYDLARDPGEQQTDGLDAAVSARLLHRLHDEIGRLWSVYFARIHQQGVAAVEMDADTHRQLEALGYVD